VVPFPVTLSDPRFQGHGVIFRSMNALNALCAQLTRDLFAIAKFLLTISRLLLHCWYSLGRPVTMVHVAYINGHFCCFDCLLTVFGTLLVHGWYSLGRHVTTGNPMVIFVLF